MSPYCEKYGKMATAKRTHCTDAVLVDTFRKWNMYFWSLGVLLPVMLDRLYRIGGVREIIAFFGTFFWGIFSFVMITLMIPVLEDQRKEVMQLKA